jgi:7-cyano-7-deazaguanine synthase
MSAQPKAIVLLSGGLDSATCLAIAKSQGFLPLAMSFRYGQRHAAELAAAHRVAAALGAVRHMVTDIDLRAFGASALTADIAVPKDRAEADMASGVPITYVPARNTIFLSFALALAEVEGAEAIFIGVNAVDYSGYPDCRPDYIAAFQRMANLATKAAVEDGRRLTIRAPLLTLSKAQIIRQGMALGVDFGMTVSCYDPTPEGLACGHCDACRLRLKGFAEAGLTDPAGYVRDPSRAPVA